MSLFDSMKEQLYLINEYNEALLSNANMNELILNQRAVLSETLNDRVKVNMIKTSNTAEQSKEKTVNPGVRIQNDPNPDYKIPVLYGRATMGGALSDLAISPNSDDIIQFVFTLAMATGNNIAGDPTTYELKNVYFNNQKVNFDTDSYTVLSLTDDEGTTDNSVANQMGIGLWNSSSFQIDQVGLEDGLGYDARNIINHWGPNHAMSGLLFGVAEITYNPDVGLDKIPDIRFDIQSSLTAPGDVLYDYMTNTVYGCGIGESAIKVTSL